MIPHTVEDELNELIKSRLPMGVMGLVRPVGEGCYVFPWPDAGGGYCRHSDTFTVTGLPDFADQLAAIIDDGQARPLCYILYPSNPVTEREIGFSCWISCLETGMDDDNVY